MFINCISVHDCCLIGVLMRLVVFSGQKMLEDFQSHLEKEEDRRDNAEEKLQRSSKILVSVKAGVDHLADKLHHLKAVSLAVRF